MGIISLSSSWAWPGRTWRGVAGRGGWGGGGGGSTTCSGEIILGHYLICGRRKVNEVSRDTK